MHGRLYTLSGDIIAPFRAAYKGHPGRKLVLLPKHREALNKMSACRTRALGGVIYVCAGCGEAYFALTEKMEPSCLKKWRNIRPCMVKFLKQPYICLAIGSHAKELAL